MYIYRYIYICMYTYIHMYIYVCIYICIHVLCMCKKRNASNMTNPHVIHEDVLILLLPWRHILSRRQYTRNWKTMKVAGVWAVCFANPNEISYSLSFRVLLVCRLCVHLGEQTPHHKSLGRVFFVSCSVCAVTWRGEGSG